MAKRIICAITALIFITSMLVFPASSYPNSDEKTENGYPIPDLCLKTDEPDVTNYCFELKRVLPSKVVKDGVIDVEGGEYYHLDIPRDEIILKGSNTVSGDAKTRSEAMRESAEAYVSWDPTHGVNFAVQYTSPETPMQTFDPLYFDGRVTPLEGSTKANPIYNDSFNDDGSFKATGEDFWAQTAFTCQFSDKTGRCFYYGIGRNTETGEYLMGHYFFSDLSGQGWGQYGYDPTYIPEGGKDFIITYNGNVVTMEWSVPFSTILGREPEDGEKIGMSMTLTQGTNPPGYNPSDPDNLRDPWMGDLENNAAILFGNCGGFQSLAAKPTRTKKQGVYDPVTDELITSKISGNLPMVAIFNTTAPEGEEEHVHTPGDPVIENRNEPSCTVGSYYEEVVYCTVCGEEISRTPVTENAPGHTPGDPVIENRNEPSCTVGEYYEEAVYCTVCGEEISRNIVSKDAPGHKYEAIVTEPTCTKQGYTTYVCSVCGDSYIADYVDPAHKYEAVVTEPTCTEQGYTTYTCSVCGDSYADDYVDALGHKWNEGTVILEPTTDAEGLKHCVCTVCGAEEDIPIPKVSHVPGDINGDGVANGLDLIRFVKYLAGSDVEVNELALDTNGDGAVNSMDLTRLLKYLAGADVEIF